MRTAACHVLGLAVLAGPASAQTFTSDGAIGCADFSLENADIVVDGATVTIDCAHTFNSLTITGGGLVTHTAELADGCDLTILGDLVIDAGSTLDVSVKGHPAGTGPGTPLPDAVGGAAGAGHGGTGGEGDLGHAGGLPYGSVSAPALLGSGGGNGDSPNPGGAGGGYLRVQVGGTLRVDGSIRANGGNAPAWTGSTRAAAARAAACG